MLFKKMTTSSGAKGKPSAKRSNSVKSNKTINRVSYSSTTTTSSTIRSLNEESTAPSSPSSSPIIVDDDKIDEMDTHHQNHQNHHNHNHHSGHMFKSVAPPSNPFRLSRNLKFEEEKAKQLRDEIARQSMDLRKLEEIAAELQIPRGRVGQAHPQHESSVFSSSSSNSQQGTSSRVIENLQHTIDSLKRELRDQTEIAKEEARGKEALAKRCDIIESSQAILKHQYESLTQLLNRKERIIKELENKVVDRNAKIKRLESATGDYLGVQREMELKLKQFEEERNRLEVGYKALLESSKSLKEKYHQEVTAIGERLEDIRNSRHADLEKLAALESGMGKQILTQELLTDMEHKNQALQTLHLNNVQKIYHNMQSTVSESDKHIQSQVDYVHRLIEQLDKYLGERPSGTAPLNPSLAGTLKSFPEVS